MYIFTFGSDPQLDVLLRVDVMFMMFCALRNDEIIQNIFVVWHYAESTNSIFKSYTIFTYIGSVQDSSGIRQFVDDFCTFLTS